MQCKEFTSCTAVSFNSTLTPGYAITDLMRVGASVALVEAAKGAAYRLSHSRGARQPRRPVLCMLAVRHVGAVWNARLFPCLECLGGR